MSCSSRNPCVIKGAGQEKAPERPIASIPQVFEIADSIEPRFRAMVLVGVFLGLRLGEMLALTVERIDLLHGQIKVVEQYQELKDGTHILGPPKSDAGVRTIAIPAILRPELEAHLATYVAPGKKSLVFCGPKGKPLRRATWYTAWSRAMAALGIEGMKPHDLRHTGNTLTAMTGREYQGADGEVRPVDVTRAALIYQHATRDRDHEIADALNGLIEAKLQQARRLQTEVPARSVGRWIASLVAQTLGGPSHHSRRLNRLPWRHGSRSTRPFQPCQLRTSPHGLSRPGRGRGEP